ncbi:O-antigen ligase family protein [Candidatus Fonsibacter ubiquis]|uniref:O-antigen ligase family protein n=1 Tax=Candidatus Fonsibacter ubiquis TaxID=1925548 RepID=UPI000C069B8D|nr:O-antigen ligase family protein [Candidatus Fonsibacter ubiquis]
MINNIFLKYFPINEKKINKIILFFVYLFPISLISTSAINNIFILIIDIFFVIIFFKEKNYKLINNKSSIVLLFFWVYILMNLFSSIDLNNSLLRSIGVIRFIILALAIQYCFSLENNKYQGKILSIWTIIFFIVSFDLIFESIFGFNTVGFSSYMPGRLASFLNAELKIGNFYFGFLFIIAAYVCEKYKTVFFFLSLITFVSISLLIGERSNFAKVIISLLIFLFFFDKKLFELKKIITFILILVICSIIILNSESRFSRFYGQFFNYIKKNGFSQYLNISQNYAHNITAYRIFLNYPLVGVGVKNFYTECVKDLYNDEKLNYNLARCSTHPHQYYFEILSETGVIGLITFVLTFFYLLYTGFVTYFKKRNLILLGSLSFLTSSLIPFIPSGSFFTTYGASIFWLNIGIILSCTNFKKNN